MRKGGYGAICGLYFPVCMQRIQDGGEVGLIWIMKCFGIICAALFKFVLELCHANKVA